MELFGVAILALVVANFIQMRVIDKLSERVDKLSDHVDRLERRAR